MPTDKPTATTVVLIPQADYSPLFFEIRYYESLNQCTCREKLNQLLTYKLAYMWNKVCSMLFQMTSRKILIVSENLEIFLFS